MIFKILWSIDALTALVFVVFFIIGIGDGTVSSFNIMLWLLILGILAAVLIGRLSLRLRGRPRFVVQHHLGPSHPWNPRRRAYRKLFATARRPPALRERPRERDPR